MDPSDGIDAYDDEGHGTACAWLVAGTGDGTNGDYKGMAPGADLLIVKVLDSTGAGDDSVIAQGIDFAVEQGVDIISLSVGGEWSDDSFLIEPSVLAVENAIEAGVTVVISAGNTGPATFTINSPGIVEGAITVGVIKVIIPDVSSMRSDDILTLARPYPCSIGSDPISVAPDIKNALISVGVRAGCLSINNAANAAACGADAEVPENNV